MMELEVPSMCWSLIGGMPYAGRCWVWKNAESMKELEDPESTRDCSVVCGRVSELRERVSESGFERADALRVKVFAWGSSMQSLGYAESQGLFSLFFESVPEDADFPWSVLDSQALEEADVDFGNSLATCPEVPQKRQSLLLRQHCCSWGVNLLSFPSFKEMSGVVDFFCLEVDPLLLVEPELFSSVWILKNLCWTCCLTWMSQTCVSTCFQRFQKCWFHGKLLCIVPSIMHRLLEQVSRD